MTDTPNDFEKLPESAEAKPAAEPVRPLDGEAADGLTSQPEAAEQASTAEVVASGSPLPDAGHFYSATTPPAAADAQQTAPQPTAADAQDTVPQPVNSDALATAQRAAVEPPIAPQPTAEQPAFVAPVSAQPVSTQPTEPQPNYGNGAFGVPPTQTYAPEAPAQTYATATGEPIAEGPQSARKRSRTGVIIGGLAVAVLVGGLAGGGVAAAVYSSVSASNTASSAPGPQNITVNQPDDATVVTAVAAKASPSVVTISVNASSESGTGSGIILSADGYVLTNTHVVTLDGEAAKVTVSVQDNNGKLYTAKVIGTDPTLDLAVIKLDNASNLTPATFANSSKLNVGDTAVAIGAPLGLSGTVTNGIVSALNRSISIASSAAPSTGDGSDGSDSPFNLWNFDNGNGSSQSQPQTATATISLPVIQTDAAINPGNSGGALLNDKGQVIGVNVAIASAGGSSSDSSGQSGSIGVGFAIPSNLAQRVAKEIMATGKATSGLLGASVADATSDSKATTVGALIKSVVGGGAADKGGLQVGDVVTNFNGVPITSATDLTAQVRTLAGGASAPITYVRGGQQHTTTVTLGTLSQ